MSNPKPEHRSGNSLFYPRVGSKAFKVFECLLSGYPRTVAKIAKKCDVNESTVYQVKNRYVPDWSENWAFGSAPISAMSMYGDKPKRPMSEKAAAIVADWNSGKINSAAEAIRLHKSSQSTAANILYRYTDYDGKPRKPNPVSAPETRPKRPRGILIKEPKSLPNEIRPE